MTAAPTPPPVSQLNGKVVVGASPIEGQGLFATAPIAAGEVIAVIGGILMDDAEFAEHAQGRDRYSAMAVAEGLNLVQAPDDPASLGNHCCDPNMWMADAVTEVARDQDEASEGRDEGYTEVSPATRELCRTILVAAALSTAGALTLYSACSRSVLGR